MLFLAAPHGNVATTNGITLGNSAIPNRGSWHGQWEALDPNDNICTVTVPAATAAIIKMSSD
jgi:hypothetical protein